MYYARIIFFEYYIDFVKDKYSESFSIQIFTVVGKMIYNLNMFFNRF